MGPIQDQECPLCERQAKFRLVEYDNRKHFRCGHCTEFEISIGAEKYLAESIPESRVQYSELARKAPKDSVLVILMSSPPDPKGLTHEYVLRSELPKH